MTTEMGDILVEGTVPPFEVPQVFLEAPPEDILSQTRELVVGGLCHPCSHIAKLGILDHHSREIPRVSS